MNWIGTALLSIACLGMVNILDSHLLSKRMPSLRAFMLPMGSFHLALAIIILTLLPLPEGIGFQIVGLAVLAGMLRAGAVVIMQYTLKSEEVSRVTPIVYSYPILVAIMAVPLLGESLNHLQWFAIFIVVAGAVIATVKIDSSGSFNLLSKPFLMLFGSSLLMACGNITAKHVLGYIEFWNMQSINMLCLGGTFFLLAIRPATFRQLKYMESRNSALAILITSGVLTQSGFLLVFGAMQEGPVSMVSAVIGSRPLVVLMYSLILSRLMPNFLKWEGGGAALALRIGAAVLVISGITIIYLS